MKKTKPTKQLLLSTEKLRDLQPMAEDSLRNIVGGGSCNQSEPCLSTRMSGP